MTPTLRRRSRAANRAASLAGVLGCILAVTVRAAPAPSGVEDGYVAAREAAIKKLKPLYDGGKGEVTAADDTARSDLEAQMRTILGPLAFPGYGPGKLNLDSLYSGDEGFGMLDGLRFDADIGANGEPSGKTGKDGQYVAPKTHILVTTQSLFARWLRAHKNWWDKGQKNVPQQIGAALNDASFYTQAISTDAAVEKFADMPMAKPAAATLVYGMLAARTQSEIPDAADEVFVSALAGDKVYVVYGAIAPPVRIAACSTIRADYNKKAEDANEALQQKRISQKAYDKLGNLIQQGEDAFKRCFAPLAQKEPAFAEAQKQAQALLQAAIGN
ncbi:hypothetical protein [Streptomyces sp. AcH 505]|uniref:hypothetical protein n=1 Tax=Streptomyces sp. AcH 505 TaxID=352211 RepID=UPI0012FE9231